MMVVLGGGLNERFNMYSFQTHTPYCHNACLIRSLKFVAVLTPYTKWKLAMMIHGLVHLILSSLNELLVYDVLVTMSPLNICSV